MISFGQFLFSAFLAALVYATIWRIATFRFRIAVHKLIYLSVWVKIEKEVKKFVVTSMDGKVEISSLNYKDEPIELEVDDVYILKVLNNDGLFDYYEINDNHHEFVPNRFFSLVVQNLEEDIINKSKKLHERFDAYPLIIKLRLDGASKVLEVVDRRVSNDIAQNEKG